MPFRTRDPVLMLEGVCVRNIDPQNPENLFGLWNLFSKCSGVMEHGKRLENLSWRLWNHEALFCSPRHRGSNGSGIRATTGATHPTTDITDRPSTRSAPELSSSFDSQLSSATFDSFTTASLPSESWSFDKGHKHRDVRMRSPRQHVTQNDLEKLVTCIKEKQDLTQPLSPLQVTLPRDYLSADDDAPETDTPLSAQDSLATPRPSSPRHPSPQAVHERIESTIATSLRSDTYSSLSSHSEQRTSLDHSHSVVRGFQAGVAGISSYRSQSQLAQAPTPILKPPSSERRLTPGGKKKVNMFQVGSSSGEDEASVRSRASVGGSVGLKGRPSKKTTSFNEQVTEIRTFQLPNDDEDDEDEEEEAEQQEGAGEEQEPEASEDEQDDSDTILESDDDFEDEDEEEEEGISESAIEDEDDDAWEDEAVDEAAENTRELKFPRVDSKPNLISRRSLLTMKVHEDQRAFSMQDAALSAAAAAAAAVASAPTLHRSRTSTPHGPSVAASPDRASPATQALQPGGLAVPASRSPAARFSASAPRALSPRTTRRQMLSEELGQSLRQHMLLERRSRPQAASKAAIQRRHTSHDVQNLTDYPGVAAGVFLGPPRGRTEVERERERDEAAVFESGVGMYHHNGW